MMMSVEILYFLMSCIFKYTILVFSKCFVKLSVDGQLCYNL